MANVSQYWPGSIWEDLKAALAWLYSRVLPPVSNWQANAVNPIAALSTQAFVECGIVSAANLSTYAQAPIENIVLDAPAGVVPDTQIGPNKFYINYSPVGLPQGNLFLNFLANPSNLMVTGRCFSLLQAIADYRVDVFAKTDVFYYKGSSSLTDTGQGYATFSVAGVTLSGATVVAALYPTSVGQPGAGSSSAQLPGGWLAHPNTGVGKKLANYKAQVYSKTDIEYLQEDNIPIIVQDAYHARAGSSVVPQSGTVTIRILYNDPVAGWTSQFDLLQSVALYTLPRSRLVPTSDPQYVSNLTITNQAALGNRAWTYDSALALIVYAMSGNFQAAKGIVKQWESFIANPGYLPSVVLENAEDGLTSRWSKSDSSASIANVAASSTSPAEPPLGTGQVIKFTSVASGDFFTFTGAGFPDATDTLLSFQHLEPAGSAFGFAYDIGVVTAGGNVTKIEVNSSGPAPAVYNAGTKTITMGIGTNEGGWITTVVAVGALISSLAADTLSSLSSFKVTLNFAGSSYFDNFSVGTLQPAGSLASSYDVYYGQIADATIRTGANAWAAFAWAIYMGISEDYSSVLSLQSLLNFLLTQLSADNDLRNGSFYLGYGKYANPGYQFVPAQIRSSSGEHNIDVWFAFERAIAVLPTAVIQAQKPGTGPGGVGPAITAGQAATLTALVATLNGASTALGTNFQKVFYTGPAAAGWANGHAYARGDQIQDSNGNQQKCVVAGTTGGTAPAWATVYGATTADNTVTWQLTALAGQPGHCCHGVSSTGTSLDVSESVDSNGTWAARLLHALGNDAAAVECLKFAYQNFYITGQSIQLSAVSNSWNQAYQQATEFSGIKFYADSPNGFAGSPVSVSQEMTWGMIEAVLELYANTSLQAYFNSVFGGAGSEGLDTFLGTLIRDQFTVLSTTGGDGALVAYSLASRDLPWEFEVFESIAATAWFWITAMALFPSGQATVLPYLIIPKGQNQSVSEKDGSTSIGEFLVECIDPGDVVKSQLANLRVIGLVARLKMLFPGEALGDAVTLHVARIAETGFTADGKLTITCQDAQAFLAEGLIWSYGGPAGGDAAPAQGVGSGLPYVSPLLLYPTTSSVDSDGGFPNAVSGAITTTNSGWVLRQGSGLSPPNVFGIKFGGFSLPTWLPIASVTKIEAHVRSQMVTNPAVGNGVISAPDGTTLRSQSAAWGPLEDVLALASTPAQVAAFNWTTFQFHLHNDDSLAEAGYSLLSGNVWLAIYFQ